MTTSMPADGFLASLAGFDRMTSARLRGLLAGRSPAEAYAVASGLAEPPARLAAVFECYDDLAAAWKRNGRERAPERCLEQCAAAGVEVVAAADERYPPQLVLDPSAPPVLFVRGDLSVLDARRVGIVGTRNSTRRGDETAARFGRELAEQGVVVVSGLARGIDGAAHRGVLAADGAPPVGVVANGLDRPYPQRHRELWARVGEAGLLLSEWPPGVAPDGYRFPLRNRILAALSEVLVVVESRERGGSLITAREAAQRGVPVFAVPGAVQNRASAGTNELLRDGAAPALDPGDVLLELGLDHRRAGASRFDPRPLPRGFDAVVLDIVRQDPRTLDQLHGELGSSLGELAIALARLERDGWVAESAAGWFEAVDDRTVLS